MEYRGRVFAPRLTFVGIVSLKKSKPRMRAIIRVHPVQLPRDPIRVESVYAQQFSSVEVHFDRNQNENEHRRNMILLA